MKLLHRYVVLLMLEVCVICVAAVDPDDEEEKCEGGPPGVTPGSTTSTAIEALGIDNVERCQGDLSPNFIMDIEWRCETRYCCQLPCDCNQTHLMEHPCTSGPEIAQLRCLVQHLHPQPRFHKWKCCDGYVEHPDTHQCLITCAKDNGDCHQACTPSVNPPYHAECSCYPGHKEHEDDPKMCTDHDECLTGNGGCTDHCNNTIGSYHCTCKEGRQFVEGSVLKCDDIPVVLPPDTQPSTQESENSPTMFIIGAIVGGLILLAILILLLVFLCRKKKRAEQEPYNGTAFANATYGDLDGQGQGARSSVAEYGDTEEIKKKVPIDGAVGVDNPSYEGEKKALEAAGYAVPNHYEEIPYSHGKKGRALDNPSYMTDSNDGYERPVGVGAKKMSLPGAVDDDQPVYPPEGANGARPKNGGALVVPPEYSEIPTPGEVEADPRPPTYTSIGRQPVRFKDFQNVKYDNMNNEILDHYVDIKDINVEDSGKK